MWDAEEGCVVSVFDRAEAQLRGLSWSRDGRHVAVASGDKEESAKTLDIIRVVDGTRVFSLPCPASVNHVSWAPHANLISYSVEDIGSATVSGKPGGDKFEAGAIKLLVPATA
jgi:WD40 repeat protein